MSSSAARTQASRTTGRSDAAPDGRGLVITAQRMAAVLSALHPEWGGRGRETPGAGEPGAMMSGAVIDSRLVAPGELFVALPGEHTHGAKHVAAAHEAGAALALVARGDAELVPEGADLQRILWVDDVQAALTELARTVRDLLRDLVVVGITGSYGKTTTKEMAAAVLGASFAVHRTAGNLNNHLGVPLTLLRLERRHEVAVVELAMSAPGEIRTLAKLAMPEVGILTGVGRAHLAGFGGSRAGIIAAKLELAEVLGKNGTLILRADDPQVLAEARRMGTRLVTVSTANPPAVGADLVAENIVLEADRVRFRVRGLRLDRLEVTLPTPARILVANALLALAAGARLGVPGPAMAQALSRMTFPARRLAIHRPGGLLVLDDCYNANPESMAAALTTLADLSVERRIAVLGDMRELGSGSQLAHEELGTRAAQVASRLFVIGGEAATVAEAAIAAGMPAANVTVARDLPDLVAKVRETVRPGDGILVKASRAIGLEAVVESLLSSDLASSASNSRSET
jgi:UDP-N-acetylmuramoyl-tripeptide--D-alanyl-D-alanine ligase